MVFETFSNKADMGVRGKASTISGAFEECAKAMTSVMVDIALIDPKKSHVINISANDKESLLVNFLNEILFLKDKKKMVYSKFRVSVAKETNPEGKEIFSLKATLFGEKINLEKHAFKVDVKAPTYSELKVESDKGKWVAQCIVDV